MKVKNLQLFLRSLQTAVTSVGGTTSLPGDLEAVSAGLEPFGSLDFNQFASFLRQAEHYRATGAVSMPLAGIGADQVEAHLRTTASLADKLAGAGDLDESHLTSERERAQRTLEQALTAFLKPLAITVTLKGDNKGFQANLKNAAVRTRVAKVRAVLAGVTDEASLYAPERQEQLMAVLDPLAPTDLKAIATDLGAPASGKKDALVSAIVERVTGVKPTTKKSRRSTPKVAVDQAMVQQEAVKIRALLEKSLDPGGLNSAELESAIRELETRSADELRAIAKEVGLEKVGKKKEVILEQIREKLQEGERAQESIEV
jgi:hypothetical protein